MRGAGGRTKCRGEGTGKMERCVEGGASEREREVYRKGQEGWRCRRGK